MVMIMGYAKMLRVNVIYLKFGGNVFIIRIVVATQFRPNNARRMFPCFDEPHFKVPFEVSVVRPRNMIALSNMAIDSIENM